MADVDPIAGREGGVISQRLATFWHDQLKTVTDDTATKTWIKRGEKVEQRYRDERSTSEERGGKRRYNSLWSNVEIMRPALYGRMPIPLCERRFRDKDPVGRGAAQMLERGLRNEIEICGYDRALQRAVSDYLLPGRGIVWVRYEPEIEEGVSIPVETQTDMTDTRGVIDPDAAAEDDDNTDDLGPSEAPPPGAKRFRRPIAGAAQAAPGDPNAADPAKRDLEITKLQQTGDRIIRESTPVDYISWQDFIMLPVTARTWQEVTAVGKRVFMSRKQMKKRFGNSIGVAVPLKKDKRDQKDGAPRVNSDRDKGIVWEIWNASDKMVYWVADGYEYLCDRKEDPLGLTNFFPVPEPLCSNPTNNTMIPVPDYMEYQDQALQIDELTQRISMLTKACKVAGVYNAAAKDVQRLMNEGVDNTLIPVDDWAAFAEKGGVEGNLSFLPVAVIKDVITELMICKQKQIEEMDRLTGINDIMRGTSDARETLGGVRLKSNNTGTRLTSRQNEVARFCRDVVTIMADIMAQNFSPQSIIDVSGALYAEGLGPDDMPSLTMLQGAQQPPMAPPGPPPMPGGPPPMPTGTNVVPFKPPGMPAPPPGPGGPPMGMQMPPEEQEKMQAFIRIAKSIELLRNEKLRGFRVDIEVDSTIFPDAAQEKSDRTEFIREITAFLQVGMQMGAQLPESIPLMAKLLQFGVRGHRVGRDLENAIEEFSEAAIKKAAQNMAAAAQKPNYAELFQAATVEKTKAEAAAKLTDASANFAKSQAHAQQMQNGGQAEMVGKFAEVQRQDIENQGEAQNRQADLIIKQMEVQMKAMEQAIAAMQARVEMFAIANPPPPAPAAARPANA